MEALLSGYGVEYFNPVVDDWNEEAQANELMERDSCDYCLYAITPKMTGTYSIAEVVDDSNKRPGKTILVLLRNDGSKRFTDGQWKSLGAVADMVDRNGGVAFTSLEHASAWIDMD
jgi:hypothetical protein